MQRFTSNINNIFNKIMPQDDDMAKDSPNAIVNDIVEKIETSRRVELYGAVGKASKEAKKVSTKDKNDIPKTEKEVSKEVTEKKKEAAKKEATKKNISIEAEKKFNGLLVGDKNKFYQVVLNLVTNGIKYSNENGNVKIFTNKSKNKFVLMVKDDGIGIPKEDLPRIFERFYTVDKSRTSKSTGLGLAIVKHIVKLFNGEIFVESEVGKGSKFTVVSRNVYCE